MTIYVSELPKSCDKCKFYECQIDIVGEWGIEKHRHICKINGSLIQGICPLQSLTEHDKQVRKEVCERLYKIIEKYLCKKGRYRESLDISSIIKQVMKENLDQIETE